jgi:hypothetical protein
VQRELQRLDQDQVRVPDHLGKRCTNIIPSEMFLGPAHPNFKFEPKHKSNAYEIEAEG